MFIIFKATKFQQMSKKLSFSICEQQLGYFGASNPCFLMNVYHSNIFLVISFPKDTWKNTILATDVQLENGGCSRAR